MSYYYYGTVSYTEFDADGQVTSAVDYVTSENSHVIYLAENHGEQSLGSSVTDAIDKANLSTDTVSLLLDGGVRRTARCFCSISRPPTCPPTRWSWWRIIWSRAAR